jgi:hypothetical protein
MLEVFRKYVTITLLLTASMCLGQSRRGDVIANIPFPFVVDGHALPPGGYIITPIGETNLRIYGNRKSVIFQTHSVEGKAPESVGKIVFHRYGGAYFLSEVWVAANSAGRQLFLSQAEQELGQRTNREVAVLRVGRE